MAQHLWKGVALAEDLSSVPWTPHKARYNIAHLQGVEAEHLHLEGGRMEARHKDASRHACCG